MKLFKKQGRRIPINIHMTEESTSIPELIMSNQNLTKSRSEEESFEIDDLDMFTEKEHLGDLRIKVKKPGVLGVLPSNIIPKKETAQRVLPNPEKPIHKTAPPRKDIVADVWAKPELATNEVMPPKRDVIQRVLPDPETLVHKTAPPRKEIVRELWTNPEVLTNEIVPPKREASTAPISKTADKSSVNHTKTHKKEPEVFAQKRTVSKSAKPVQLESKEKRKKKDKKKKRRKPFFSRSKTTQNTKEQSARPSVHVSLENKSKFSPVLTLNGQKKSKLGKKYLSKAEKLKQLKIMAGVLLFCIIVAVILLILLFSMENKAVNSANTKESITSQPTEDEPSNPTFAISPTAKNDAIEAEIASNGDTDLNQPQAEIQTPSDNNNQQTMALPPPQVVPAPEAVETPQTTRKIITKQPITKQETVIVESDADIGSGELPGTESSIGALPSVPNMRPAPKPVPTIKRVPKEKVRQAPVIKQAPRKEQAPKRTVTKRPTRDQNQSESTPIDSQQRPESNQPFLQPEPNRQPKAVIISEEAFMSLSSNKIYRED